MPQQQDLVSIRYNNWDGMLNAGVSDFLMLNSECVAMKNCWVTKIGRLEKVPGYSVCTTPISSESPSTSVSVSPSSSVSPSTSPTLSESLSPSVSPSISISVSPSISFSISPSISSSISVSVSPSVSISESPSTSLSISISVSPSISLSTSPSVSISPSISVSVSPTHSESPSNSPSISISLSPSISVSVSPPNSYSPSVSTSISSSISPSISKSTSVSASPSISVSKSPSISSSISLSKSPSLSVSISPSISSSISYSISKSISPSFSPSSDQIIDGEDVNYLHNYYDTANRISYMLATSDNGTQLTLRRRTTNLWTSFGDLAWWDGYAGSTVDMANYLGKAFIVGYKSDTTFLPNALVNGTTFESWNENSSLVNMPQGKFIVRYRDLLYVLHAYTSNTIYPTRAYYSDEPTAGAITWNNLTTTFVEFGYDDGDLITGGVEALDLLIVFKTNSMWRYDESSVEQIADIGCDSHRSIKKINKVLYWYNRDGFWRWRGGQPELISAKVQPFVDAMDQTTLTKVVAVQYNGFEYRAFIGTVTVDGITYENAWFCWDTRREKCYIRCTAHPAKSCCVYQEDGKRRAYFGDDDGYVYRFATPVDKVYDDNGEQIDSFFITKNLDYGVPESKKIVNRMTPFTKNAVGMKVAVDVDNRGEFKETNTKVIRRNIDDLEFVAGGNLYKYKFYEKGKSKSWQFNGFVISTKGVDNWQ